MADDQSRRDWWKARSPGALGSPKHWLGPMGTLVLIDDVDVGLEMRQVGVRGRLGDELIRVKEKDKGRNSSSNGTQWGFFRSNGVRVQPNVNSCPRPEGWPRLYSISGGWLVYLQPLVSL